MKIDKKKAEILRKGLDTKIIKLIAPSGMSIAEYKISCELNGIDPTTSNGPFLHWVMTATSDGDTTNIEDKVHRLIVNALEKGYLIDVYSKEQCSYFCDAVRDMLLEDKEYATQLLEAVLKNFKDSPKYGAEVFEYCRSLNRAFGFTRVEYFKGLL